MLAGKPTEVNTASDPDAGHACRPAHSSEDRSSDALAGACQALWLATLSLMTAFMLQGAPAHRFLLARRIARNLATLAQQPVYPAADQLRFERLARRWGGTADRLAPQELRPRGSPGLMQQLRAIFS